MARAISVLLVDDHALLRKCLQRMLEDDPELAVIGEASNGAEAVELARELAPQVVVMDLEMPIMDGIQAARHILRLAPATAILMLSMSAKETCVRNAFEAGAQGYLLKNAVDLDLGGAVKAVASGKRVLRIVFGAVVGDLAVETIYNGLGGKI
jgi:DNA-binding NarL/FixJ family response regulator